MAADAAGNDLSAAKIVVTSAFRFAPYDATQKLTADLIAPTVADVKTGLDKIFSKGGFVGLITEDGAPQDSRDADDAIKFHQPGYSINGIIGEENICSHINLALKRANEIIEK